MVRIFESKSAWDRVLVMIVTKLFIQVFLFMAFCLCCCPSFLTAAQVDNPRATFNDILGDYKGGFRFTRSEGGYLTTADQQGRIAVVPGGGSFFSDSHAYTQNIAQWSIPALKTEDNPVDLNLAVNIQPFESVFDKGARADNPSDFCSDELLTCAEYRRDWVYGMAVIGDELMVNAVKFYDAVGITDQTIIFGDKDDLATGGVRGWYSMAPRRRVANYISQIPVEWQTLLGGDVLMGNGLGMSINGTLSIGPSLYTINYADLSVSAPAAISTTEHLLYPKIGADPHLAVGLDLFPSPETGNWDVYNTRGVSTSMTDTNPIWTDLSKAQYGFIVPGSRTFAVIGSSSMHHSGGHYILGLGPRPLDDDDYAPYYWLFDINEILAATDSYTVMPYEYGPWQAPYDKDGDNALPTGASFDSTTGKLYVLLRKTYWVGEGQPVVLVYDVDIDRIDSTACSLDVSQCPHPDQCSLAGGQWINGWCESSGSKKALFKYTE